MHGAVLSSIVCHAGVPGSIPIEDTYHDVFFYVAAGHLVYLNCEPWPAAGHIATVKITCVV